MEQVNNKKQQTLFNKVLKNKMQIIALEDKRKSLEYEIEVKEIELTRDDLFTPDESLVMGKKLEYRKQSLEDTNAYIKQHMDLHVKLCEQYDKLQSKGKGKK